MAIEMTIPLVKWNKRAIPEGETDYAVSYTHLTLPTTPYV